MSVYRIYHWNNRRARKSMIMLPVGAYYNTHLQKMRKGDFIQFQEEEACHEVLRVAELDLNSQMASLLTHYLYGVGKDVVISHWRSTAIMEGCNKHAVSVNKCLVVHYDERFKA